jgi:hypothetical protein
MDNVWRYYVSKGCLECGGIVFADVGADAILKVLQRYRHLEEDLKASEVLCWRATKDDEYDTDFPDLLEVYC